MNILLMFHRIAVHYKYLSALLEKLDLPQKLTFVIHDWGSCLGFHWCNMHKDRVKVSMDPPPPHPLAPVHCHVPPHHAHALLTGET